MEVTEEQVAALSDCLTKTLSLNKIERKQAERTLESIECNKNHALVLLRIVNTETLDISFRINAAIEFNNYIRQNWTNDDENRDIRIGNEERTAIKSQLLNSMVHTPDEIKKKLSDAISIIGKYDFPYKWSDLLTEMVEKFRKLDFPEIVAMLYTARSLFERYRCEYYMKTLEREVELVLNTLAEPLTTLFKTTMKAINQTTDTDTNESVIKYKAVLLMIDVFHSLNYQELPPCFERKIGLWMNRLHKLLKKEIPFNGCDVDTSEQIKAQIYKLGIMFAEKYDIDFRPFLPKFFKTTWNMLKSMDDFSKYDVVVIDALQFLAAVALQKYAKKNLFANPAVMDCIFEKLILPNIEIRESDLELFHNNPEQYILMDIEGSDVPSRRRSACNLVRGLFRQEQFAENKVTPYIQEMLAIYKKDVNNWKAKDTVIYLVTSAAMQDQVKSIGLVENKDVLVNLADFARSNIIPELKRADVNAVPVVKADCIKYIMCFRRVLPRDVVISSFSLIVKCLDAKNLVIHTYAAATIEKILDVRKPKCIIIVDSDLNPVANSLLNRLMGVISRSISRENDYAMKAMMRTFEIAGEDVGRFLPNLLPQLIEILNILLKNPEKTLFNQFLFETFALSVTIIHQIMPEGLIKLENALYPAFERILQDNIEEFVPYTLEILTMILDNRELTEISGPYLTLWPFLSSPMLWDRPVNVHPLVKLICTYISKCEPFKIDKILNIRSLMERTDKLLASRVQNHEGFKIVEYLITHCPLEILTPYLKEIVLLLFKRLTPTRTTKYVYGVMQFFCIYMLKYEPSDLITRMDAIQPRMFEIATEKALLPGLKAASNYYEKKIATCGIGKLITEAEEFYRGTYSRFWIPLLRCILKTYEHRVPIDLTTRIKHPEMLTAVDNDRTRSMLLVFGNNSLQDLLPTVVDARLYVLNALYRLSFSYSGGKVTELIRTGLTDVEAAVLFKLLKVAGLHLL